MSAEETAIDVAPPSRAALRRDRARRISQSSWTGVLVCGATIAMVVAPIPIVIPIAAAGAYGIARWMLSRNVQRFFASMRAAYAQADRGSFDTALNRCRAAMASAAWPVSHIAALTMAYFLRRSGDFDRAITLCGAAAKGDDDYLRPAIGIELALIYALKGATGPAMTWLPAISSYHSPHAASYAVVWTRTGKQERVKKLKVRQRRSSLVFVLHEVKVLALLKAFVVYREKGDYLSIRPLLLEIGRSYDGEFDYLGKSWPEMAEFIETYVAPKG